MESNGFEAAFSAFLERREYDDADAALFSLVRATFRAGWEAAGGISPEVQPIVRLVMQEQEDR